MSSIDSDKDLTQKCIKFDYLNGAKYDFLAMRSLYTTPPTQPYKKYSRVKKSKSNVKKRALVIYVLELENNKYYVGKTTNLIRRWNDYFDTPGQKIPEWVKINHVIKPIMTYHWTDSYDEDKITFQLMERYGIDNVRGGSFSKINLSTEEIKFIQTRINGATDACFTCGEHGHFSKECPN